MLTFLGASFAVSLILNILQIFEISSKSITGEIIYELLYSALYFCMFFIPVIMYKKIDKTYSFVQMPCKIKFSRYLPLLIFSGLAVNYIASYINAIIVTFAGLDTSSLTFGEYVNQYHSYNFILDTIKLAIVPAFCEELFFRGLILERLSRFGKAKAIIISALLFSLMHQHPAQLFYTFILGIFLGYMALESGSIWGGIILHFVNNFTQVIITSLEETQSEERATFIICAMEMVILVIGVISAICYFTKYSHSTINDDRWLFGTDKSLSKGMSVKGFFAPTMIVFVSISAVSALAWFVQ